jgi:hypothetical protein
MKTKTKLDEAVDKVFDRAIELVDLFPACVNALARDESGRAVRVGDNELRIMRGHSYCLLGYVERAITEMFSKFPNRRIDVYAESRVRLSRALGGNTTISFGAWNDSGRKDRTTPRPHLREEIRELLVKARATH